MNGLNLIQPVLGFVPSQTSQQIGVRQALQVVTKTFVVVNAALVFSPVVLKHKFDEHGIKKAKINIVEPMQTVPIAPFEVQFVPVSHSVPETMCLFISTSVVTVVHSGDWNLDPTPVIGVKTEPKVFPDLGKKGVLA